MAIALAFVAAVPAAAAGPTAPAAQTRMHWIATGWNIKKLAALDPATASYDFDAPSAYALGNTVGTQNQVLPGFASQPTLKYDSFAQFENDVASGRLDASIKTVVYDPENWSLTPDPEKRDPIRYLAQFESLAHAHGLFVVTTPSRDLMAVHGATCGKRRGETISAAFVRCNIAGRAAARADALEVQAQALENDTDAFTQFVVQTRTQALAGNPRVIFLAGLSTSPAGYVATAQMLVDADHAVHGLVAGYFLSIQSGEEGTADAFLRRLQALGE